MNPKFKVGDICVINDGHYDNFVEVIRVTERVYVTKHMKQGVIQNYRIEIFDKICLSKYIVDSPLFKVMNE